MEWLFKHCFQPIHNIMNEMGDELSEMLTSEPTLEKDESPIIIQMDKIEEDNVRKRIVLEEVLENC